MSDTLYGFTARGQRSDREIPNNGGERSRLGCWAKALGVLTLIGASIFGGCEGLNRIPCGEGYFGGRVIDLYSQGPVFPSDEVTLDSGITAEERTVVVGKTIVRAPSYQLLTHLTIDPRNRNGENQEEIKRDLRRAIETGERVTIKTKSYLLPAVWNGETQRYIQKVHFSDKKFLK